MSYAGQFDCECSGFPGDSRNGIEVMLGGALFKNQQFRWRRMAQTMRLYYFDARVDSYRCKSFITVAAGTTLVRQGKAAGILDDDGRVCGFELLGAVGSKRGPATRPAPIMRTSQPSSSAISRREAEAVAGLLGKSSADRLSDDALVQRIRDKWVPKNFVESSRAKLALYPATH